MMYSSAEFERITRDLLDRCKAPVTKALQDAGLQLSDVSEVILVGGSTRMPAVVLRSMSAPRRELRYSAT